MSDANGTKGIKGWQLDSWTNKQVRIRAGCTSIGAPKLHNVQLIESLVGDKPPSDHEYSSPTHPTATASPRLADRMCGVQAHVSNMTPAVGKTRGEAFHD